MQNPTIGSSLIIHLHSPANLWVNELIHGHPNCIFGELGMQLHVFTAFYANLALICEIETSRHGVTVEEQATHWAVREGIAIQKYLELLPKSLFHQTS